MEYRVMRVSHQSDTRLYSNFGTTLVVTYLIVSLAILLLSLVATDGKLVYTLDDPYIHLALAETILDGSYGINSGEFSSPSSSIIYPYILAAGLALGLGEAAPLLIAVLANILLFYLLGSFISQRHSLVAKDTPLIGRIAFAFLLVVSINGIGLQFTGMEHSLHVLATAITVIGLVQLAEEDRVSILLCIGVVLAPLVRFEGIALSGAAIGSIFIARHYAKGIIVALVLTACLTAYAIYMRSMDLPIVPSSILVKSSSMSAAVDNGFRGIIDILLQNAAKSMGHGWGILFYLGIVAFSASLLLSVANGRSFPREGLVIVPMVAALGAHILAGAYGWFSRYEVYAVCILLIGMLYLSSGFLNKARPAVRIALPLAALSFVAAPYLTTTLSSPLAAQNIYEQQFQMHRFATEFFPHPVAVNDLGWVAFRNNKYVLDLWGLGSEKVRRLHRTASLDPTVVAKMAEEYGVVFAMVYDEWLRAVIPASWCRIGVLSTSKVTAASGEVAFYLIDDSKQEDIRKALDAFSRSLPSGATMSIKSHCP